MMPPDTAHHGVAQPGTLIQTRADRHLAAGQWLLSAAEDTQRARKEWADDGIALLRCGTLFTAVRLAAGLVYAAADSDDLRNVDAYLRQALPDLVSLLTLAQATPFPDQESDIPGSGMRQ